MSRFFPGARKVASALLPSTATLRASRCSRWMPFAVAWLAAGCTLVAESFDPRLIDAAGGGGGRVGPDPVDVEGGSGGGMGARPGMNEGGEGPDPDVPLDPGDPQNKGGAVRDTGVGEAGLDAGNADDDGVEVADTGGVVTPDAAEPPPEPCPGPTFAGSCYEFFGELLSWDAAEAACVARGGHIAALETLEEDAFLAFWPIALGVPAGDGSGIWLGATDAAQENDFRWANGAPFTFNGWGPGQPDNGAGIDCIEKRNDATARWYDQRCTDLNPYVCEKPL